MKQTNQNAFVLFITSQRLALMGLAIVAILLYHSYVWIVPEESDYLKVFKFGYIGVDVFMFLSGFGLCFSYTRNKLSTFYYRRLMRIFPLNIIAGMIISLFVLQHSDSISVWDIVCNITTLYYYGLGGTYWNWYIPAIVILYLLFPILFYLSKRFGFPFYVSLNICIVLFLALYHIDWRYSCLISRLPIFVSGIHTFIYIKRGGKIRELLLINFILFSICCSYNLSEYYLTATFCPLLLLTIFYLKKELIEYHLLKSSESILWKYSLEIVYRIMCFTFSLDTIIILLLVLCFIISQHFVFHTSSFLLIKKSALTFCDLIQIKTNIAGQYQSKRACL